MLYFKHSELVNTYHVSLKTVHNWIDAAKQKKLNLDLYSKGDRVYIANNPGNIARLEKMAQDGKKYRNTRYNEIITPSPRFYEVYNRRQTLDIISNLLIHKEIPRQYNYFDYGAQNWDDWLRRLEKQESPNILNSTIKLIHSNLTPIDTLLQGYKKVNVIDLGVGNARPAKELLGHILSNHQLNRYVAIDISQSMLNIAQQNIHKWFGDKVRFEGHIRDLTHERFDDLVLDDMLAEDADQTVNLMLLLGATPVNFRSFSDALRVIYGSMGAKDLLVYTDKADTETSRQYFDFHPKPGNSVLSPNHKFMLELLNIDDSLYDVEMGFDEQKRMRFIRIRLKKSITLRFEFDGHKRDVHLEKADSILMLRVWHMTALETISEFEKSGFVTLHSNTTKERQFVLTVSGVNTHSDFANPLQLQPLYPRL